MLLSVLDSCSCPAMYYPIIRLDVVGRARTRQSLFRVPRCDQPLNSEVPIYIEDCTRRHFSCFHLQSYPRTPCRQLDEYARNVQVPFAYFTLLLLNLSRYALTTKSRARETHNASSDDGVVESCDKMLDSCDRLQAFSTISCHPLPRDMDRPILRVMVCLLSFDPFAPSTQAVQIRNAAI